jgi:ParB-like chromosome segregation protein Spo0J
MKNAADKVEHYPIEKLIPYARNSRTHSDEQVSQIAASMKEWGITSAVLIDETGGIIAGHGRVMAAKKLGLQTMPVMVASGWTEAQKRAFVIADNKLAMNAGWDAELLKLEMKDLDDNEFDLSKTGFGIGELSAMFDQINFEPGKEEDQGKLDELDPKMIQCPHCGQDFDLREYE